MTERKIRLLIAVPFFVAGALIALPVIPDLKPWEVVAVLTALAWFVVALLAVRDQGGEQR